MKDIKKKSKNNKCCGVPLDIVFEGEGIQYPIFSCSVCGASKNDWAVWWDKYSNFHLQVDFWKEKKHAVVCLVGRFCAMFQRFYNRPYTFSYSSPIPFKEKTFTMARRIIVMFNGNALESKKYLEWAFINKVRTPKYNVTSLGFFASSNFVNEYKGYLAQKSILRRSTPLPDDFLAWCKDNEPEIFDRQELNNFNNLNGLVTHVKSYNLDDPENRVVNEAVKRGMLPSGPEYRSLEG